MISNITKLFSTDPVTSNPPELHEKSKITAVAKKALEPISEGSKTWITPGNMERAAYTTGAALLATAAVASYTFSPTLLSGSAYIISGAASVAVYVASIAIRILPAPLAALSGCALWAACETPDYDNPRELAKYKEEATSMSLKQIFTKHPNGWAGVHKIITQEQFIQKFKEETSKINNIPDLEKYGQGLSYKTNGFYKLPSPKELNQERLKIECASLSYDEAIKLHDGLANIIGWKLFSFEQIRESHDRFHFLTDLKKLMNLHPTIYPEINAELIKAGFRS